MEVTHTFVVLGYGESQYLETCIQSVMNQKHKSDIVIATSTPNEYISAIAEKYHLPVLVNSKREGIGTDFEFARTCVDSNLVTIAHQDDVYEYEYGQAVMNAHRYNPNSSIIFSDYFEIRENERVFKNLNLKIKRILLLPIQLFGRTQFTKRLSLSFGDPICCPAVTFVNHNIDIQVFDNHFKCDVDWDAWEKLSKQKGRFVFIKNCLMGHRVHEESTTTEIISDNIRTIEDFEVLQRFWPKCIAKCINRLYVKSENSNQV
ncbi:MAG: glycosyltransferase [Hespellia sp.]|nr:glycosyltransferase [Hespellia sp.]